MLAELIISQAITVALPYPFLEYCAKTKDPGCIVETLTPKDLAYINKLVTETIITVANSDPLEPWTPFPPDRKGDCGHQAATERQILLALGVDPKAMRFETGEVTEPDGRKVGHIVLLVTLDGKEWVMDRKTPDMLYPPSKRPYEWRPLAKEVRGQLVWKTPD